MKLHFTLAFSALLILGLLSAWSCVRRMPPEVDQGMAAAAARDYAKARAAYDRALERGMDDADRAVVLSHRAYACLMLGDTDCAVGDLNRAASLAPENGELFVSRGLFLSGQGDYEQAADDFEAALSLGVDDMMVYLSLGTAQAALGRTAQAALSLATAAGKAPPDKRAAVWARLGDIWMEAGDAAKAAEAYGKALALNPGDARARSGLGLALIARAGQAQGREARSLSEEGLAELDRSVTLAPYDSELLLTRGQALAGEGRYREAIRDYDRALELDAGSLTALARRGEARLMAGEARDAADDFIRAEALAAASASPLAETAWITARRGDALRLMGVHQGALEAYDLALSRNPGLASAHAGRGLSLLAMERGDEAEQALDRAVELNVRELWAYVHYARLLLDRQLPAEAMAVLEKGRRLNTRLAPEGGELYALLGRAQLLRGDQAGAEAAYREAASLEPGDAATALAYADLLRENRRFEAAADAYIAVLDLDKGLIPARTGLALALAARDEFDEADAALKRAADLAPESPAVPTAQGLMLRQKGENDAALAAYGQALEFDPAYSPALLARASLLRSLGKEVEAARDLDLAVAENPGDPTAWGAKGDVDWGRGQLAEAVNDYSRAIELAGETAVAGRALARRGAAKANLGFYAAALEDMKSAVALAPFDLFAANGLAWLLAAAPDEAVRSGTEAVEAARRAQALAGESPVVLSTLAAALARDGRFDEAVAAQAEALALLPEGSSYAAILTARLEDYRRKQPFVVEKSQKMF